MLNALPGTNIEIGKWYLATKRPPKLANLPEEQYTLLLGIKDIGPMHGYYDEDRDEYFWHCQRYDGLDDQPIPGWTREQEINNNLDWVLELARGVMSWMIIPTLNDDLSSIDGLSGYDPNPDEDYKSGRGEQNGDETDPDED